MLHYTIRRLLFLLPILYAVSTLVFFFIHVIPGDPVDAILGEQALVSDREVLRHQLNLDEPLWQQQFRFVDSVLHGDLGRSLFSRQPVTEMILQRFPATLHLALCAIIIALFLAIPLGIGASLTKGSWVDRGGMLFSLLGISMPNFWLGPLLALLFAVQLDWLPLAGRELPGSVILPAITLGASMAALTSRLTRSSMLDVLREDYVRTARAKGLSESTVIGKHALVNALNPVVTIVGLQFGALLAGAIVTEKIFSWPGIGTLLITAIERRDYPVVQGCILTIAATYALVNLATDLLYARLDPRVKLGRPSS
jgi:peptide/nickel transport system permease protein